VSYRIVFYYKLAIQFSRMRDSVVGS